MVERGLCASVLVRLANLYSNKDCNAQPGSSPTICLFDGTFYIVGIIELIEGFVLGPKAQAGKFLSEGERRRFMNSSLNQILRHSTS